LILRAFFDEKIKAILRKIIVVRIEKIRGKNRW